jgi:hypothetical protein
MDMIGAFIWGASFSPFRQTFQFDDCSGVDIFRTLQSGKAEVIARL